MSRFNVAQFVLVSLPFHTGEDPIQTLGVVLGEDKTFAKVPAGLNGAPAAFVFTTNPKTGEDVPLLVKDEHLVPTEQTDPTLLRHALEFAREAVELSDDPIMREAFLEPNREEGAAFAFEMISPDFYRVATDGLDNLEAVQAVGRALAESEYEDDEDDASDLLDD